MAAPERCDIWGVFLNLFYCLCRLCSSNSLEMEKNEPTHSENPNFMASSSSASPAVGDCEGGTTTAEGNDYEVFLSFRGKDTRTSFTDHLYTNLVKVGINVFRDDNELRVGEEIGPELRRSITQSMISIPIISEGYASSTWCLCELAHMLKCMTEEGQIVLPIFYKVKPSQVRNSSKGLSDAINAHEKKLDKMDVKKWEEALIKVSSLKGWESETVENGHEGALVEIVVRKVMSELKRLFQLNIPEQLVGIDDRVEQIMNKIDAEFDGTWITGIHGMGGIGKTTLAKVVYNKLSSRFESCSFLANIRETSRHEGIKCLQKQLISDIIGKSFDVSNVDEGISLIKSRFKNKKILILLDDMDDIDHSKALLGDGSWFKKGSIVIITTRNKRILDNARADHMYQLDELPQGQSLVLFSRHAFGKDSPPSGYKLISHDVVYRTNGLPLALEVIGSFLCGRKMEVWRETSKKLKKVPDKQVRETLRISYDALEEEAQQIFLDIACFFIGSSKQNPTYMWDACGFLPETSIEVLSHMSLIKITKDGKLTMHDQLRDLGREIVRLEDVNEPQKRSRLWKHKDIVDVLVNNKGTTKIEALRLDSYYGSGCYTAENFKKLTSLRFLEVNNINLIGDFQNLLPQLRWLEWDDCPSDFEAANFHPKELIVLDLSWSTITEDWGGWGPLKMATKLKVLNLRNCALKRTPDLSSFKSLEILTLKNCENLEEIHPSIEDITTLISLNVKGCVKLKELPSGIGRMKKLRELLINDTDIQEIPISRGCLTKLETLKASRCELLARLPEFFSSLVSLTQLYLHQARIEEIPESIGSVKELKTLDISYCASLAHIPSSIGDLTSLSHLDLTECHKLAQLPDSIGSLVSLPRLLLSGCRSLRQIPNSIGKLTSLTELHLKSTAIEELPESIGSMKELKTLDVSYCASLAHIPSSIGDLTSLSHLDLTECHKLAQLPDSIGSLMSLSRLLLSGCRSLRQIPNSIGKLTSLVELHLKSTAIEELPESIGNMQNLRMLDISGTPIIEWLDGRRILAELQGLRALGWKNLEGLPSNTELNSRVLTLVLLKRPRTPLAYNSAMDYQTADFEHVLKKSRPFEISDKPPATATLGSGYAIVGASVGDRGAPVVVMFGTNSESMANVNPRIADEMGGKSWIWKLIEINEPSQCLSIRLPNDDSTDTRVSRLIYTNSGLAILALSSNAVHKLWKWQESDRNLTGRAPTSVVPQLWQPPGRNLMTNDTRDTNPEDAVPCFALSKNNSYLISASGGKISLFNVITFKTMTTFMPPPPPNNDIIAIGMEDSSIQVYDVRDDEVWTKLGGHHRIVIGFDLSTPLTVLVSSGSDSQTITTFIRARQTATFLAFLPRDNNVIAIGMEDSSIQIYNVRIDEVKAILRGHQKRITGLAFSNVLNVLVSSGADSQLCVWSTERWEEPASKFQQMLTGRSTAPLAITRVQFHVDQIHLLVVHETQIAIYEAPKLKCIKQWVTREASGPITDATYSCNGQSIYLSFKDGSIGVLTASELRLRCRINPAAYIPSNPSSRAYPLVIAAHPSEPNQFALGLTDGSVYVLEPLASEGEWGTSRPVEDGAGPSMTSSATGSDQPQG